MYITRVEVSEHMKKSWTNTGILVGCILLCGCSESNETVSMPTVENLPVAMKSIEVAKEERIVESSEKINETKPNKAIEVDVEEQVEQLDEETDTEAVEVVPTVTIGELIGRWCAYDYSVDRTVTVDIALEEALVLHHNSKEYVIEIIKILIK